MSNSSSPSLEKVQASDDETTYSLQQRVHDLEHLLQKKEQQLYEKNMELVKGQKLMNSRRQIQKERFQKRMTMRDCTSPKPTSDFDSINTTEALLKMANRLEQAEEIINTLESTLTGNSLWICNHFTSEEIRKLPLERMESLSKIANSVKCYARIHGYQFILIRDTGPNEACQQNEFLFRRHCLTATVIQLYDIVLFLDADIGVVNPNRKIENFLEDSVDLIFYDRFQNWEIATGSYLARSTNFAVEFLKEFASFESKFPNGTIHGSDNGAIHEKTENRNVQKIKILQKGESWVRDGWITNSQWSLHVDFMLHGWKMSQLRETPNWVLKPIPTARNQWFSPFSGKFHLEKCTESNSTWNYNVKLIGDVEEIQMSLRKMADDVEVMKKKALVKINNF
ncbi:Protein CBG06280 [Caenorhabditis briggsae]|uniref:Protein CBG06280 n=1 Tax=Caenorhabditis briggsae TaxID=6238 RepID=A8X1V1_CAEBR|nr:Protein CBG06280 [Caenorhabditis briggsae]CAP26611.2 Protein CBG06280 [Caenorhabditis briggsae]